MPLTTEQIEAARRLIDGYMDEEEVYHRGLNDMETDLIRARDDVIAFGQRLHQDVPDVNATAVLAAAKARALAAAEELVVLLS